MNYALLHALISHELSGTNMSSKSFIHDFMDEQHLKTLSDYDYIMIYDLLRMIMIFSLFPKKTRSLPSISYDGT